MIDYRLMELQNPWWNNADWALSDPKIKEFEKSRYKFIPASVLSLPESRRAVHVISGPRQTGKSTSLKLKIQNLLDRKINPKSVLYYNCDALSQKKDIIDLISEYLETSGLSKKYIFLDEISSIPDWSYGIKWLADEGFFQNCVVYLTGSSGINLKKSGEFMPGRRGRGQNVDFFPLSFWQVLNAKGCQIEKFSLKDKNLLSKLQKIDPRQLAWIKAEFANFLSTGGFINVINNPEDSFVHQIYQETLRSEIIKNGKNEKNMRMVIKKLINSLSSETSYTNIAEEAELGSKNTAIDYLDFLVNSYFLHESLFYEISQKKFILKKNKKYHFSDPYVLWNLWSYFTGSGVKFRSLDEKTVFNPDFFIFGSNDGPMIENFTASELIKTHQEFFYYRNSRELDFYLPNQNLGIEVKSKDTIVSEDLKSLEKVRNKILVSKNTLEMRDKILIIPSYLFPLIDI